MPKILVVDDEEHIRLLYSEELSQAGYEVITAEGGYKLIERIEEEKPDWVGGIRFMTLHPVLLMLAATGELKRAFRKTGCIPVAQFRTTTASERRCYEIHHSNYTRGHCACDVGYADGRGSYVAGHVFTTWAGNLGQRALCFGDDGNSYKREN